MATLQIQCTDTRATRTLVEVFRRGSNGQPDTLVQRGLLPAGTSGSTVSMPDGCYVVVRAATEDEAKSIDNW